MSGQSWRQRAACAGVPTSLFFPRTERDPRGRMNEQARAALAVCGRCPVIVACLTDELRHPIAEQHGVRGGLLASQRRRVLQVRRRQGTYDPVTVAAQTRRELNRLAEQSASSRVSAIPATTEDRPATPSRYHHGARPYRSRRRSGVCARCTTTARLPARGLCSRCYERLRMRGLHVTYPTRQQSQTTVDPTWQERAS